MNRTLLLLALPFLAGPGALDGPVHSPAGAEPAPPVFTDCSLSAFHGLEGTVSAQRPIRLASYRPASPRGQVRSDANRYPGLVGDGARWERYDAPDGRSSVVAASVETAQGCTRLYMSVSPQVLQVGLPESSIETDDEFIRTYESLLPPGYSGTATYPAVEPGEGEILVRLFLNGNPVQSADVFISTDSQGDPGDHGTTFAHEHILEGAATPSIRVRGQVNQGQEVRARTDDQGELRFWVRAGYRGGIEMVIARARLDDVGYGDCTSMGRDGAGTVWQNDACWLRRAVSVVVRDGQYRNLAHALGYGVWPDPSDDFPFLTVGWSRAHYYPHFMPPNRAQAIVRSLQRVWADDRGRQQAQEASGEPHFINIGHISLEYGGRFELGGPGLSQDGGSHKGHDRGVDIDIAPCYSYGERPLNPQDCASGSYTPIDERVLAAHVIGRLGGVITRHDGYYHIRLPPR